MVLDSHSVVMLHSGPAWRRFGLPSRRTVDPANLLSLMIANEPCELYPRVNSELFEHVTHVSVHGMRRNVQGFCDLPVGPTTRCEGRNTHLCVRQRTPPRLWAVGV